MRKFNILFDNAEPSAFQHSAYEPYGNLGFPAPPPDRPWICSNFVQSLDGIASFKGRHATGGDISQLREDRWLMDLLPAHADGVLLGVNTLIEETQLAGDRGPIYSIEDADIRSLRQELGLGKEKNIFVTGAARLNLSDYRVFDSDAVEPFIITTIAGERQLVHKTSHPHVKLIVAGDSMFVDLPEAMRTLKRVYGMNRLLCEGGPTLYGYMSRTGLIDEKFLTISPLEVGFYVPREQEAAEAEKNDPPKQRPTTFMAPGFTKESAPWWQWISCRRVGDHQFDRYRRKRVMG